MPGNQISKSAQEAMKKLLRYSWGDIDFKYENLTRKEKDLVSEEQFRELKEAYDTILKELNKED